MTEEKKRAKAVNYTQKTRDLLRDKLGYRVDTVERYMPYHGKENRGGYRKDMFDFADLIAMKIGKGIVAVQTTGQTGHSTHKRTILSTDDARYWLACGGRIALISWVKKRNILKDGSKGKCFRWKPRVEEITLSMFE